MSAHLTLRHATAANHEAVDDAFGGFDLSERASYSAFLRAHAHVLPAIEQALARVPALPPARPRAALLAADLAALGVEAPQPLEVAAPEDEATAFGMLYVIEGSRLGGGMLARRVPAGLPAAYLGAVHEKGEWRALLDRLDDAAEGDAWIDAAVAAARKVFALYAEAARLERPDAA